MTPDALRQGFTNRAEMIVRGTQDSGSGWYDSPDDLVAVIAEALHAAYQIGRKALDFCAHCSGTGNYLGQTFDGVQPCFHCNGTGVRG